MDPMRSVLARATLAVCLLAACGSEEAAVPTEAERLALPADVERGQRLFRACAVCHDARPAPRHRVGPNLAGILGAPAARHADFAYSAALERSGIVWDREALDAYIAAPQAFVPGNRMAYEGDDSVADRRDIIAYLESLEAEE